MNINYTREQEYLFGLTMNLGDIPYEIFENPNGESTIIIPMNRVKDKSKLKETLAKNYERCHWNRNEFSDFLAKYNYGWDEDE